ncbi:unnamed protein product [Miscanthus lutarioriparius]|uniref:Uncharacterized protein n=1 Tax=Miscanthus lutarioriparius TaxID=422564 RepID=A0A811PF53_9POAL|nr:unnamed protein product [Miscanthus lutarioriparius]
MVGAVDVGLRVAQMAGAASGLSDVLASTREDPSAERTWSPKKPWSGPDGWCSGVLALAREDPSLERT